MLNETNHGSGKSLQYRFGAVQDYFDPDQVFHTSVTNPPCDKADFDVNDKAETAVLSGEVTAAYDAYERAVQALRDLRHLLPADGVAIVDAVLDSINVTRDPY